MKTCLAFALYTQILVCAIFCVSSGTAQNAQGQGGEDYLFAGHIKVKSTEYFFKIRRGESIRDAAENFGHQHGFTKKIVDELVKDMEAHLGENPKRRNKQSNDDAKNIAAGHGLFSAWLPIGSKMSEFSNRHYKTSLRPITSRQCPVASNDGSDQQASDVFTAISKKYVG